MEYIIGSLITVVFFICVGGAYFLGMKQHPKSKPLEVDEKEKQRIKQYNDHFKALFSYDVDTALKRKRVSE